MTFEELYAQAKSVLNLRRLSADAEAGGVGAVLLTLSGKIYIGVCIVTELPSEFLLNCKRSC